MTNADHVICVGKPVKTHIQEHYRTEDSKITIIPRGVDTMYFDPSEVNYSQINNLKKKYSLNGKFIVGCIGRISPLKDYETIISAISRTIQRIPNVKGLFIGGPRSPNDKYAESLMKNSFDKCGDSIVWAEPTSKVREFYSCCDLVLNASPVMCNVARTILEGIAMNKPVLSTEFNNLERIIQNGRNGFYFKTQDPDDLSDKILRLHDQRLRNIRDTIPREFTLTDMVESTIKVYQNLLKTNIAE